MPKLKGRGLKQLQDRVSHSADGITFRFDDHNVFEFWLEATYTKDELLMLIADHMEWMKAHPEECKPERPRLFKG